MRNWDSLRRKHLRTIDAKLDGKLTEYHKSKNIEKLADLIQVISAATKTRVYTLKQLNAIQIENASKRGDFDKKILLIEDI